MTSNSFCTEQKLSVIRPTNNKPYIINAPIYFVDSYQHYCHTMACFCVEICICCIFAYFINLSFHVCIYFSTLSWVLSHFKTENLHQYPRIFAQCLAVTLLRGKKFNFNLEWNRLYHTTSMWKLLSNIWGWTESLYQCHIFKMCYASDIFGCLTFSDILNIHFAEL